MPVPTAELTRLSAPAPDGYNDGDYNASTNPLGFGAGGHRHNFFPAFADMVVVANWVASEVSPLVDIGDEIEALAAISASIPVLAALDDEVAALAAISAQISAVYAIAANISTVAARATDIVTLAVRATDMAALADIEDGTSATHAIQNVAAAVTSITNVAAALSAINSVAAALSNINTVAGIASSVSTVAGQSANITALAAITAAISTCAANISAISGAAANASAAAASAVAAASAAAGLQGSSTSSLAIGTGTKTFVTQAGKQFILGAWILAVSDASPTVNWMLGQVTSYSGTSLQLNVTRVGGSGTKTDWTISVSGPEGPPNAGDGDTVGAASSTAGNAMVFADNTGKVVADSGVQLTDLFDKTSDDLDAIADGTTYKKYSDTEKSKLAGIEASADVTDAGNVGSAIAGAHKATPVSGDKFALLDSAAADGLVYSTHAEVLATFQTSFDSRYSQLGHTHSWASLTSKPTTLAGAGITDAASIGFAQTLASQGAI